jgi:hypothetical protein
VPTLNAGSQTGLLNIFNYGEWEDYSDRFPGHPSSIDAIVKVDEDTILTVGLHMLTHSLKGFIQPLNLKCG